MKTFKYRKIYIPLSPIYPRIAQAALSFLQYQLNEENPVGDVFELLSKLPISILNAIIKYQKQYFFDFHDQIIGIINEFVERHMNKAHCHVFELLRRFWQMLHISKFISKNIHL